MTSPNILILDFRFMLPWKQRMLDCRECDEKPCVKLEIASDCKFPPAPCVKTRAASMQARSPTFFVLYTQSMGDLGGKGTCKERCAGGSAGPFSDILTCIGLVSVMRSIHRKVQIEIFMFDQYVLIAFLDMKNWIAIFRVCFDAASAKLRSLPTVVKEVLRLFSVCCTSHDESARTSSNQRSFSFRTRCSVRNMEQWPKGYA